MTEFTLGAQASCSDGSCGEVIRTILDPATRTVTHLVIEPKHRKMDGRLVPIDLCPRHRPVSSACVRLPSCAPAIFS